ncbi:MAG: DUF4349 domain-containing protein [Vulcanibacillus sp.]
MNKINKHYSYKFFIFVILIALVFILASCGASTNNNEASPTDGNYDKGFSGIAEDSVKSSSQEIYPSVAPSPTPASAEEYDYKTSQMIIYNGSIIMEVTDISDAIIEVEKAIKNSGGYLINSNKSENDNQYYARYEYKVPVEGFYPLIDQINTLPIGKVTNQYVNGNDVTEEYLDIDSRLKAKRVYEERLLDLFAQANNTEDLLKISNDLSRVQEEIEQLEGRQKYLSYHAANSTLSIEMQQFKDKVSPTATSWEKSVEGFKKSIEFIKDLFVTLFIWVVSSIPVLILLTALIILAWLLIRNKVRQRKSIVTYTDITDENDDKDSK